MRLGRSVLLSFAGEGHDATLAALELAVRHENRAAPAGEMSCMWPGRGGQGTDGTEPEAGEQFGASQSNDLRLQNQWLRKTASINYVYFTCGGSCFRCGFQSALKHLKLKKVDMFDEQLIGGRVLEGIDGS